MRCFLVCAPQLACQRNQSSITTPQAATRKQHYRRKQTYIHVPNTTPHQRTPLDEVQHLVGLSNGHTGKIGHETQNILAILQVAARKLAEHERMDAYLVAIQQTHKLGFAPSQMVNPKRK